MSEIYQGATTNYSALPSEIGKARVAVIQALGSHLGSSQKERLVDIEIALGEVLQNVVRYEFGGGDVSGWFGIKWEINAQNRVAIQIFDNARPHLDLGFLVKEHKTSDRGGMGLALIAKTSKKYEISSNKLGNIHLLIF
jgi:anti-sigma regulatory factor (Ser/Thr protein kinase)